MAGQQSLGKSKTYSISNCTYMAKDTIQFKLQYLAKLDQTL